MPFIWKSVLVVLLVLGLQARAAWGQQNNEDHHNQPQHEEDAGASDSGRVTDGQHVEPRAPLSEVDPAGLFAGAADRATLEARLQGERQALADDRARLVETQNALNGLKDALRSLLADAVAARQRGDAVAVGRLAADFQRSMRQIADSRRERRDLLDEVSSRSQAIDDLRQRLGE